MPKTKSAEIPASFWRDPDTVMDWENAVAYNRRTGVRYTNITIDRESLMRAFPPIKKGVNGA